MKTILILVIACLSLSVVAEETRWKSKAEFRFENFVYQDDESDNTNDYGLSQFANVEVKAKNADWLALFRAASRVDSEDIQRSSFVLEEAWISQSKENFRWKLGAQKFNWSATEAFHPVDVINARNYNGDEFELEKIGELGLELAWTLGEGELGLYVFPTLTSNIFPSSTSRKSTLSGLSLGPAIWVKDETSVHEDNSVNQFALVYKSSLDSFDYNLVAFKGWDKHLLTFSYESSQFQAVYYPLDLIGMNSQIIFDTWILKLEMANKAYSGSYTVGNYPSGSSSYTPKDHQVLAWGIEYSENLDSGHEYYFLAEAQHILGVEEDERVDLSFFQNDLLLGLRYLFNDASGKELFVSYIRDLERDSEEIWNANYSQRFWKQWKYKVGLRGVLAPQKETNAKGVELLDGSNFAYLNLSYYF